MKDALGITHIIISKAQPANVKQLQRKGSTEMPSLGSKPSHLKSECITDVIKGF